MLRIVALAGAFTALALGSTLAQVPGGNPYPDYTANGWEFKKTTAPPNTTIEQVGVTVVSGSNPVQYKVYANGYLSQPGEVTKYRLAYYQNINGNWVSLGEGKEGSVGTVAQPSGKRELIISEGDPNKYIPAGATVVTEAYVNVQPVVGAPAYKTLLWRRTFVGKE